MIQPAKISRDVERAQNPRYTEFWKNRERLTTPQPQWTQQPLWLEIGAGSGDFFVTLAQSHPSIHFVPIERCRTRAKTLLKRSQRLQLPNLAPLRGNAIPMVIDSIPDETVERIYILYPCPWRRNSQRRQRWHLHPMMPHLKRILVPGGLLIWTSDQAFYIEEAEYVCRTHYQMETRVYGPLQPNAYNFLDQFPEGRSKFERDFLGQGLTSHELVSQRAV